MASLPCRPVAGMLVALLLAGCNNGREDGDGAALIGGSRSGPQADSYESSASMPPAAMKVAGNAAGASAPQQPSGPSMAPARAFDSTTTVAPSMLIRTGQATVEVKSVDTAVAQLHQLAQRIGGYVANSSAQGGKHEIRSATVELKIPAARFEEATGGLRTIGTVEQVNVNSEDVGEEYVDITARITNARRLEQRLVDLLAQSTGKLTDVLAVERELARVREEIERYEGRARYLRTRAAVSTLAVTVHEERPVLNTIGQNPIAEAFRNAWRGFVGFVVFLISSLGVVVPTVLLIVVGWLVWKRQRNRRAS